ncbi:MAG: DUF4157 domain-containing protein [Cyclobacteriaceae bacterium]
MNSLTKKIQQNKGKAFFKNRTGQSQSNTQTQRITPTDRMSVFQQKLQAMAADSPQVRSQSAIQRMADEYVSREKPVQLRNSTQNGLPEPLKSGIESLSGVSMSDVKVHRNSGEPAQLQAHAFAQGTDIHLASGQEKHLPHEAWHVVQQKQGRVAPTIQLKNGPAVNNEPGLENEADIMGAKAMNYSPGPSTPKLKSTPINMPVQRAVIQRKPIEVTITGITHLVKMIGGSLMEGKESIEVHHGTPITIDNEDKYRSRRGPNQELYEHVDRKSEHLYRWFKVLKLDTRNVSGKNLYLRDETFVPIDRQEKVSTRPAKIDASHRLRDMNPQTYDYEATSSGGRKPSIAESFVPIADHVLEEARQILKEHDEGTAVQSAVKLFSEEIGKLTKGTFIGIIYGSYATGNQRKATEEKPGSDIDAMFSCDNHTYVNYRSDLIPAISYFLKGLHDLVGATVDDEVPAESKHLISASEMMKSASGKVYYPQSMDSEPTIHTLGFFLEKVVKMDELGTTKTESQRFGKEFLASEYLRLRLIFNILTSPNKVYASHKSEIVKLKQVWLRALHQLSKNLISMGGKPGETGVEHLLADTHSGGKNDGEMFLGYKRDRKGVIEHLQKLLHEQV